MSGMPEAGVQATLAGRGGAHPAPDAWGPHRRKATVQGGLNPARRREPPGPHRLDWRSRNLPLPGVGAICEYASTSEFTWENSGVDAWIMQSDIEGLQVAEVRGSFGRDTSKYRVCILQNKPLSHPIRPASWAFVVCIVVRGVWNPGISRCLYVFQAQIFLVLICMHNNACTEPNIRIYAY